MRGLLSVMMVLVVVVPAMVGCSSTDDEGRTWSGTGTGAGGSDPEGSIGLQAVPAHEAIGLEWQPVEDATGYNLYWSNEPGVTPSDAVIPNVLPGVLHEGLVDGTTYHYVVTAITGEGESGPSNEASATPTGPFGLYRLGTGSIVDIVGGGVLRVPIDERIHVVLLSEGYLAAQLDTFDQDVDDWHGLVFAMAPYSLLQEAFVIWTLPTASAEHVSATSPQQSDTAWLVPLAADGKGVDKIPSDGPTAARVWEAISAAPFPPVDFYESGGLTSNLAKNLIVHVLVLEPLEGASGLSGRVVRLKNPGDPDQRLAVAFAHNRQHEFSHALARLRDEYLDVENVDLGQPNHLTTSSQYVSNVVLDSTCDTLPWAHLLFKGAHNLGVDQLVGAFGRDTLGFHPELKCLMNGSHDNADYYGGDGKLRVERFCNFCRELVFFRILERAQVLSDPQISLETWAAQYRPAFYDTFGFIAPELVPQSNSDGMPLFEACTP